MTKKQFKGGWKVLRGAGLQGGKDADEDIYFEILKDIDAKDWGDVVARANRDCAFFPQASALLEIYFAVQREARLREQEKERVARRSRELPPVALGHPAFPAQPGMKLFAYLEALAFHLGELPRDGRELPSAEPVKAFPLFETAARDPGQEG